MNYKETCEYLFSQLPQFEKDGATGFNEGLRNTLALDKHLKNPHRNYLTIHVAGTNGKGSCSHTLAAILQTCGYKVGLYTSPHLVDFRERIRVNGQMISEDYVVRFVAEQRPFFEPLQPSFFEVTTAMAFKYFEEQRVDIAVIEVGLGGRLDCTNIITPVLSVITNISFDHVQFLGDTLPKIASEKAGIIKAGVPVCIGENINEEVKAVFQEKAEEVGAPITFAEDRPSKSPLKGDLFFSPFEGELERVFALTGLCQEKNRRTILTAVHLLREQGIEISDKAVKKGFAEVTTMTGLMGRWQTISTKPLTICDTGHNVGGMQYITQQLQQTPHKRLHIVIGMVSDKDVSTVLSMLPKDAVFYFTQASVQRAMPAEELAQKAISVFNSLPSGKAQARQFSIYKDVVSAYQAAQAAASDDDLIFIGGSTFVVADLLRFVL